MPRVRVHSRLWRFLLSLTLLGGVLATPAAVSADGLVRFSEHAVNLFCDASGEEGELHLFAGSSSEFGEFAELVAWAAPVDPESPPDISGFSDEVTVVEAGGGATLTTTIPVEGIVDGDAVVNATLSPTGDVLTLEPVREGNRWINTTGTIAFMEVTGTLDLPGDLPDFTLEELGCGGEIVDIEVFETQPHAFVNANEGIVVDCFSCLSGRRDRRLQRWPGARGEHGRGRRQGGNRPDDDESNRTQSGHAGHEGRHRRSQKSSHH